MFIQCVTILINRLKVIGVVILMIAVPENVRAQSCACIDEVGCAPCEEGISRIVFEFNGETGLIGSYTIRDGGGIIKTGFLTGDNIVVNSTPFNEPFQNNYIAIRFYDLIFAPVGDEIVILTNCNEFKLGKEFGNGTLKVLEAASPISGPLCCEPEDTDQIPPELVNLPQDIELSLISNCTVDYTWTHPTVVDDCGPASFVLPFPSNNQTFQLGTRYINYFARDLSNNIIADSFAVTVIDEIPPDITNIPSTIELTANNNCIAVATWSLPNATDNCEVVEFSSNRESGSAFPLDTTEVIYTARDNSGNTSESSFKVIVSDNTPPVFYTFPNDITVSANENCEAVVEWNLPSAADNCGENVDLEGTNSSGDTFSLGSKTVEYIATDEKGNSVSRSFKVIVIDDVPPVFTTFPENMRVSVGNSCESSIDWVMPVAQDNCSNTTIELLAGSPQSGDIFNVGVSTVSYKASDTNGNEITQSFEIEVVDDQAPIFTGCPQDIIIAADATCTAVVEWQSPQVSENCELSGEVLSNFQSGTRFEIGSTEVMYTTKDPSGNETVCSFNVTVRNNFEPLIENCPQDVELEQFERQGVPYDWEEPKVSLECADLIIESNYSPGDLFMEGTTEVQYYYEVNGENIQFCSFMVNVKLAEIDFTVNELMTPNGDGDNDTWIIDEITNFPKNSVTIVDRWGSEIYRARGYNNENTVWNGSNKNGNLVPSGTYYYFITVEFESSVVKRSGFLELIR